MKNNMIIFKATANFKLRTIKNNIFLEGQENDCNFGSVWEKTSVKWEENWYSQAPKENHEYWIIWNIVSFLRT